MQSQNYNARIKQDGWAIIPDVLSSDEVDALCTALANAHEICRKTQIKNNLEANMEGTAHHILGVDDGFLKFLGKMPCHDYLQSFFSAPYIINSFGGFINTSQQKTYVHNIHRDIRSFFGLPMMMNMLVMLDDFTLENGATFLLSGSHLKDEKPPDDFFFTNAKRATGRRGAILLFDSHLWHAAGHNQTQNVRRALTLTYTKPYFKQQLDYCRQVGYDKCETLDENTKQVLGWYARMPTNLNEWYQPRDKRFYRSEQG